MNNTTMNVPISQISQSIKIECKTDYSVNIPYFFTTINESNKVIKANTKNIKNISKKNNEKK